MKSLVVVEREVTVQAAESSVSVRIFVEIYLLVFHAPPKSFANDIVQASTLSIQAYAYIRCLKNGGEVFGSKLATLVSVPRSLVGRFAGLALAW